jgi:dTDP-4-dehydrorhamnose 3,5-epimerase
VIFHPLPLAGAYRIALSRQSDERGFFARRFCQETFAGGGLATHFVERSVSFNVRRGTLRGLHYQVAPAEEIKTVRCTRGAVFDVIVDIRSDSPTCGRWHSEELTADNHLMLYVPAGFAHGFQSLCDSTELDYEITAPYTPSTMRGIHYADPALRIPWPLANPIVSDRDKALPSLSIALSL